MQDGNQRYVVGVVEERARKSTFPEALKAVKAFGTIILQTIVGSPYAEWQEFDVQVFPEGGSIHLIVKRAADWSLFYPSEGEPRTGYTVQQWIHIQDCRNEAEARDVVADLGELLESTASEGVVLHAKVHHAHSGKILYVTIQVDDLYVARC
jgi:hypothetical protein